MAIPQYMEKGSRGPAANIILVFLNVWASLRLGENQNHHHIQFDGIYGETGSYWMKRFQEKHGIEPDGGVGPTTRQFLKTTCNFDFELAVRTTGGESVFVQPDRSEIRWAPWSPERDEAEARRIKAERISTQGPEPLI